MNRNRWNLLVDGVIFASFVTVVFSGFTLGELHGSGGALLGLGRRAWHEIHECGSYLLVLGLVIHLLLHGTWLKAMFRANRANGEAPWSRHLGRTLLVLGALLMLASVFGPQMLVRRSGDGGEGIHEANH